LRTLSGCWRTTGLLALANEYNKVERHEDEAAVLGRYVATHEHERTNGQHLLWVGFSASLTGVDAGRVELTRRRKTDP